MAVNVRKAKGRSTSYSFVSVPKHILESEEYAELGAYAVKLLLDLYAQYNGKNNGDFCAAWSVMKNRGWRSKATLDRSIKELKRTGFILLTRQGGKHKAALYAVTFKKVNECKGKIDIKETREAPDSWKFKNRFATPNVYQCTPNMGQL